MNYYKDINDMKLHALSILSSINAKRALMLKVIITLFSIGVLLVIIPNLAGWW